MTQLVFVEQKPREGLRHRVQSGATVGRAGCDIVIVDPGVSRRHAVIRDDNSGPAIEDVGSTNGTFVNERRVTDVTELQPGDSVRFGSTVWRLEAPSEAKPDSGSPSSSGEQPLPNATAPPRPAAPVQPASRRGDAPAAEVAPSAIRRALPLDPSAGQAPAFSPPPASNSRRSAARSLEATLVCYAVLIATAVAVFLYFAQR